MMKNLLLVICLISSTLFAQQKLTVEQCIELAIANNKELKIADKQLSSAEANIKVMRANYLPNFKLEGTLAHMNDLNTMKIEGEDLGEVMKPILSALPTPPEGFKIADIEKELGQKNVYQAALVLEQPIYMGGKITAAYKMSKIGKTIRENQKALSISHVKSKTENAYWRLVSVKEKEKVVLKYKELLEDLVRNLTNSYDLELINRNELLKAQVKLNDAELNLLKIKNGHALSKMALCEIIGKDLLADIDVNDQAIVVPLENKNNNFVQKAMNQRAEIKMLENNVSLKSENIKLITSDFLPQLSAGVNFLSRNPNKYMEAENEFTWNAGIKLSFKIFHWGERKNKITMAKIERDVSELTLQRNKELITLEVHQAKFKLQESIKRVELAENSLLQANENLEINKNSFKEGLINTTEMLEAQAQWQTSNNAQIDAKIEYKINEMAFRKAQGEL